MMTGSSDSGTHAYSGIQPIHVSTGAYSQSYPSVQHPHESLSGSHPSSPPPVLVPVSLLAQGSSQEPSHCVVPQLPQLLPDVSLQLHICCTVPVPHEPHGPPTLQRHSQHPSGQSQSLGLVPQSYAERQAPVSQPTLFTQQPSRQL
jgi:hypothetical protein